ncbi:SMC-Scp complex subunit ScpB [Marilutibacter chinensis]|uniref:SMC-Scp complex subunit ScpB n=1 Tax=Marilutibacter chinensis TaxID=2912247 RepID=A0ABS9HPI3_9GAMM|nr:SMC-Scp complex subunit ScpB [Lysobacter chinensis]MCF7220203.1 SMC-Scp complex subunit ScpB [Lysobacter chinensis]
MDQSLITRIVEAALLAANQPLTLAQLHALFPEEQPAPNGSVETAIETLQAGCADRGVELVELASGFRFQVKADVHAWVARLWTERQTRYTRATLETLALIAYRQPITRGEIEQVRGVAVNSNIIKALEEREWIRVVGHRDVPGKPALFGTTKAFLDYFGLKRLDELPPLSELKEIGELEPELGFGDGQKPARPAEGEAIAAGGVATGGPDEEDAGGESAGKEMALDRPGGTTAGATEAGASDDLADNGDVASLDQPVGHERHIDAVPDDDATSSGLPPQPEAAPGERAADENDEMAPEPLASDDFSAAPEVDEDTGPEAIPNAVETTTVPESEAASDEDAPEQSK